jgi:hypothetical protein
MGLVLSVEAQELGVGVAVALFAQLFVRRATPSAEGDRLRGLGYRWPRLLPSPWAFLRGSAAVIAAAFEAAGGRPSEGRLHRASAPPPSEPGELAMATIGASMAPRDIVIDVAEAPRRFLFHELAPRAAPT